MNLSGEVVAALGMIVAAYLGYLGSKFTARSAEETKRIETSKLDWDAFTERIM